MEHLGKGFLDSLIISMPVVLTAAAIGLVVGILQAVTQVQEQTIAAAPKILGVFLVLMLMGGMFTKILTEYTQESIHLALNVVTKNDDFIQLPEYSSKYDVENNELPKDKIDDIMRNPGKAPFSNKQSKFTVDHTSKGSPAAPNVVEGNKIFFGR